MVVIFLSLLHIANSGQWMLGDVMCKVNVFSQQFVLLISILSLLLMCAERAIGKSNLLKNIIKKSNVYFFIFAIYLISTICCVPLFLKNFVTLPDRFHFQCLLNGQSPIGYTYFMIFLYILITVIIGIMLILIRIQKHVHRSLPNSQEEYGRFINETRELHEYSNLTKLTIYLLITYTILQLPYIVMIFFNRIREALIYESSITLITIYSDLETLITFLRFMFPFASALIISFRCFEIWVKIVNLLCCRRAGPITINQWNNNMNTTANFNPQTFFSSNCENNVITLVATGNGMQLRVPREVAPNSLIYAKPPPSYIEMKNEESIKKDNGDEEILNSPSQSNGRQNEENNFGANFNPQTFFSSNCENNVITLVSTGNCMQLRVPREVAPDSLIYAKPPPSYIEMKNEESIKKDNGDEEILNSPSQSNGRQNEENNFGENIQRIHKMASKIPNSKIRKQKKEHSRKTKNLKASRKIVVKGQFVRKKLSRITPTNEQ
uniref:G_PROTEIN_RECEP_F1_2 domain-containing protein n=1 Tax=Strongyloides papillosus TaxID=174720 RepID=A0A0N5B4B1_STREA